MAKKKLAKKRRTGSTAKTKHKPAKKMYWQIGRDILSRQQAQGWGAKVVDHLSTDLRKSFPEMKGFSPRNLKYMRSFAEAWPDEQLCSRLLHKSPGSITAC